MDNKYENNQVSLVESFERYIDANGYLEFFVEDFGFKDVCSVVGHRVEREDFRECVEEMTLGY